MACGDECQPIDRVHQIDIAQRARKGKRFQGGGTPRFNVAAEQWKARQPLRNNEMVSHEWSGSASFQALSRNGDSFLELTCFESNRGQLNATHVAVCTSLSDGIWARTDN